MNNRDKDPTGPPVDETEDVAAEGVTAAVAEAVADAVVRLI